jgi:hypothetical protein
VLIFEPSFGKSVKRVRPDSRGTALKASRLTPTAANRQSSLEPSPAYQSNAELLPDYFLYLKIQFVFPLLIFINNGCGISGAVFT